MPADNFLQLRAQIGTAVFALGSLVRDFRESDELLGAISNVATRLKDPLKLAIAGDVGAGKSTLLNVLFETEFCATHPSSPNKRTYVYRHTSQAALGDPPPGIVDERLEIPFLRDFTIIDTPGLRAAQPDQWAHVEAMLPEIDILLFAFSAADPWKAELWDFLTRNKESLGRSAALLILQADSLPPDERESVLKYFQQTAMRKLGDRTLTVLALSSKQAQYALGGEGDAEGLARESNITALYEFLNRALLSPHPRAHELAVLAGEARDLAREATLFARKAMDDLRHDEREIFELERGIITQMGWLRRDLQGRLVLLQQSSVKPIEAAVGAFAASIKPTRLDALAHNRSELARNIQDGVIEALSTDFATSMDETAERFEAHLSESWQSLFERLKPRFIKDLKGPMAAFPHLKEAHGALLSRLDMHLHDTLVNEDVVQHVRGMLGQAASINFQPIVIVLASVLAGALAAFQSGCEIAGGMIFCVGILAAGWSVIAGIGFRRLLRSQYRQLCESQVRELVVRVRGELEGFAESILDEIGKKLRAMNEMGYSTRTSQEPIVEKTFRIGETLDGLAARIETRASDE
jgi:hypothetical protein